MWQESATGWRGIGREANIDFWMVGTRASARLRAVSKEELNSPKPDMAAEGEPGEVKPEGEAPACSKCDELRAPTQGEEPGKASDPPVSSYLVGFAKRVVICTILVFAFKHIAPQVQNKFWPEVPEKEGKCYVLNDKSFKGHISRGDHIVMMYAPWCGHCQRLKPTWDTLAKRPGVAGVKVSKVDCTASTKTCGEFDVKGYPTILYFRNGKKLDTYDGAKSETELREYINRMKTGAPKPPGVEDMLPPDRPVKVPSPKKAKKSKKKAEL